MSVFSHEYRPTLHRLAKQVRTISSDGSGHVARLVQHAVDTHKAIRAKQRQPKEKEQPKMPDRTPLLSTPEAA